MPDQPAVNDLGAMLPMLMAVLSKGMGGGLQAHEGEYEPRLALPGLNQPYMGFSFGQALSPLGEAGTTAGAFGDVFGQMFFPEMMSRLQANAGVNPYTRLKQQEMQRALFAFSTGPNNDTILGGLGIDPASAEGKTAAQFMPFAQAFMPDIYSNLATVISPNAMTQVGGQRLLASSMMRDPMGQFDRGRFEQMTKTFDELTKTDDKFRNDVFTSGMTRDDFALMTEYTADQGLTDVGMDRKEARERHRGRIRKERFKDRREEELTDEERGDLDVTTEQAVDAEGLVRGASNQAQYISQLKKMVPGATTGQAAQLAATIGLNASDSKESSAITKLLRELDALGAAAGMTTQNMVNAGRALQAQNGGDMIFNMQAAAMAGMADRFGRKHGAELGMDVNDNFLSAVTGQAKTALSQFNQGGLAQAEAAIYTIGDEKWRKRLDAAYAQAMKTGDGTEVVHVLTDAAHDRHLGTFGMPEDRRAAMQQQFTQDLEKKGINRTQVLSLAAEAQVFDQLKGTDFHTVMSRLTLAERREVAADLQSTGGKVDAIKGKFGLTGEDALSIAEFYHRGSDKGSLGRLYIGSLALNNADESTWASREAKVQRDTSVSSLQNELSSRGAGQGTVANIRAGNIHSFGDVLQSMGYQVPEKLDDLVKGLSDDEKKRVVRSAQVRANALTTLDDDKSTAEARNRALIDLSGAENMIGPVIPEKRDYEKVDKYLKEAEKLQQAQQAKANEAATPARPSSPDSPIRQDRDRPSSPDSPIRQDRGQPTGAPSPIRSPAPASYVDRFNQAVDRGISKATESLAPAHPQAAPDPPAARRDQGPSARLEIDLKINGESVKNTDFQARATVRQGFRDVVVNGVPAGGLQA